VSEWDVLYRSCYNEDGSLLFPERLSQEFLDKAKKHLGTQFFSNQYLNKVIDETTKPFKKQWIKYYEEIPENVYRFIFIDPAISLSDSADFTAVAVVAVESDKHWYLEHSSKHKITPTKVIDLIFQLCERFRPMKIGIEDVAFQKVLVYMAFEEMERRNMWLPLEGVKPPSEKTKLQKILGLVPRFEWGQISVRKGLHDFEDQYLDYAGERSKHDDILDALSSVEALITYPIKENELIKEVAPNHPDYERYYRLKLMRGDKKD
jgi:predicted phage terminase large subunit-like protein